MSTIKAVLSIQEDGVVVNSDLFTVDSPIPAKIDGESIPEDSTDLELPIAVDFSSMNFIYMKSTVDMTIETNSGSVADDTIVLKANKPIIWFVGQPNPPITQDVTGNIFVTTATVGTGLLTILVGQDVP